MRTQHFESIICDDTLSSTATTLVLTQYFSNLCLMCYYRNKCSCKNISFDLKIKFGSVSFSISPFLCPLSQLHRVLWSKCDNMANSRKYIFPKTYSPCESFPAFQNRDNGLCYFLQLLGRNYIKGYSK